jgi:hypothetical protein
MIWWSSMNAKRDGRGNVIPTQHLNPAQQNAVERLARIKGIACKECRRDEFLTSDDTAFQSMSHINVRLFCANPDADHAAYVVATDRSFPLSFDEAEAIGIKVQGRNPPPRRRSGETFPR